MKNPMKPEEQCQAILDNAAGYAMQVREIGDSKWADRLPEYAEQNLDFIFNEYRRKPEQLVRYTHVVDSNCSMTRVTLRDALESRIAYNGEGTIHRLVEDPDWVEPTPAMPPMNPCRKIIRGEWPECKPSSRITLTYENGCIKTRIANDIHWDLTNATHWRYAEDE